MIFHPPRWQLEYELGIVGDVPSAPTGNKSSVSFFKKKQKPSTLGFFLSHLLVLCYCINIKKYKVNFIFLSQTLFFDRLSFLYTHASCLCFLCYFLSLDLFFYLTHQVDWITS
jgi:hypothetical protein